MSTLPSKDLIVLSPGEPDLLLLVRELGLERGNEKGLMLFYHGKKKAIFGTDQWTFCSLSGPLGGDRSSTVKKKIKQVISLFFVGWFIPPPPAR